MDTSLVELVEPKHTAVVVIDVQNDFCHSDGGFAKMGRDVSLVQQAAHNTHIFLEEARKRGVLVIFVRNSNTPWNSSPAWQRKRNKPGRPILTAQDSWGAEFFVVKPLDSEPVVVKHRYSAFIGTDLNQLLRSRQITTIVVCGVVTQVCVESTARDGYMLDYDTVVLSDCTGTTSQAEHAASLKVLDEYFAFVVTAKDVQAAWAIAPAKLVANI